MRLIYTLLITLALPFAAVRLWWRARRQLGYMQHVGERFGHYPPRGDDTPLIWLHAVSVGETRAAEPLIRALMAEYPAHRILLTHMTPTGRETGESLFGNGVLRCYLPYDYPRAVKRFLAHYRPKAGVLMETEIWPNLVHACKARGVPLYLANARLSEKSFMRYQRVGGLSADTLRALTAIAAQSEDDARRFRLLGATNVSVTGNLKFDVAPSPIQLSLGEHLRESFGARRVLLAASTRDGEEALLLDHGLHEIPDALLVIVPRHPQRFDEVAALLKQRGIPFQRRSANAAIPTDTRVLLGDSMGEMAAYYAACDVAFIGGSLLPFGGQNLIEACAVGKPVLLGPHTYNFAEAAERAVAAGAALRVMDGADLQRKLSALLGNPKLTQRMSAAALAFSGEHGGATRKILALIRF
ncbi:MAG: 3-deoxy-D-manno-octulosonic acid transferase [Betaproteobacteria bacterium]|nr:3-deoxy-D-manno-octulosonic acid transferase [Betaproteobacteria bacterium]